LVVLLLAALFGGAWAYRQERNDRREDVARPYPGISGGPAVDASGRVVGVIVSARGRT
jgi:hypothetical protein